MRKQKEINELLASISRTKLTGFNLGFIAKKTDLSLLEAEKVVLEWVKEGKLSIRYILYNVENVNEKKVYDQKEEIPVGEYFDDFSFGEEFLVEMDMIENQYYFKPEQRMDETVGK